jgi:hypothetical protein
LKPGGWFELQEFDWMAEKEDGTIDPDIPVNRYMAHMEEVGNAEGRQIPIVPTIGSLMKKAGFVDIHKETFRCPYGRWPIDARERRRGRFLSTNAELVLPTSKRLLGNIGMTEDQTEPLFAAITSMFRDDSIRCYATYYVWYGRKPKQATDDFGNNFGIAIR